MLYTDGDTNVYMQYSHARIQSILAKSEKSLEDMIKTTSISLKEDAEYGK